MGKRKPLTPEQLEAKRAKNREYMRAKRSAAPEAAREVTRESVKKWREANEERAKEIAKSYRKRNAEKVKTADKRKYENRRAKDIERERLMGRVKRRRQREKFKAEATPEQQAAAREENKRRAKEWRLANLEYAKAKLKEYLKTERGRAAKIASEARRKAAMLACDGNVTRDEWLEVFEQHGRRCFYCGCDLVLGKNATMDHVVPLARGGPHRKDNIIPACRSCNSRKKTKSAEEFLAELLAESDAES